MGLTREAAWLVMFSLRAAAVVLFASRALAGDIGCGVWAAVEAHALVLAACNEWSKRASDHSAGGVLVPVLYLAGAFCHPIGSSSSSGQSAIAISAVALFVVRLYLGRSYSVAGSTWSQLAAGGPYRWIRHPMLCCQLVTRAAIVCEFPSVTNVFTFAVFVVSVVLVIHLEERFLMTRGEYRDYAKAVRFRLIPFMW